MFAWKAAPMAIANGQNNSWVNTSQYDLLQLAWT